ncbi:hypothetical protein AB6D05_03970 [Vibrio cyclitrophicus]
MSFIPWFGFVLLQFSLVFFIPKRLFIDISKRFVNFLQLIFYVETALLFIVVLMGVKAGVNQNIVDKSVLFFVYSLMPISLVYFFLLIIKDNNKINTVLFLAPTILMASKSGMIFSLVLMLSAKVLKREPIFTFKVSLSILFVFLLYPVLITIAIFKRTGGESFLGFFTSLLSHMGGDFLSIYGFVLTSISRRVSGIDVLMIPTVIDNFVFSLPSIFLYALKGFFTAAFIDTMLSMDSVGIGRLFAIEFLNQNKELANGFEPTFYGVVFHSLTPFVSSILLYCICLFPILFFRFQKNNIASLMLCYFIFVYIFVFMSGTIVQLTQVFRFYIILHLTYYVYIRVRFK